jgi:succinate dehydrogenase/fumarate reductase cytochrome b subunit
MPLATVPFFGAVTGPILAEQASQSSDAQALALLWIISLAATVVAILGARHAFSTTTTPTARRTSAAFALVLAVIVALAYVIGWGRVNR